MDIKTVVNSLGDKEKAKHAVVCPKMQDEIKIELKYKNNIEPVSYTHLDVYKRQHTHTPEYTIIN